MTEALPEATNPASTRRVDPVCAAIVVLYVLLCAAYIAVIPPGYGPDEREHTNSIRLLAEHGQLSVYLGGRQGGTGGGHALHPPLYYASQIPMYYLARKPGPEVADRTILALRLTSVLWGLLTLWQLWLFLGETFPARRHLRLAVLGFIAFLPEYLLISSVVNNDIAATFFGILLLRRLAAMLREGSSTRLAVQIGLAMAGFAWAKAQMIMLLPLGVGWLLLLVRWKRVDLRQALRDGAIAYGLLVVLGCWWYVRNWTIYGHIMPSGLEQWGPHGPNGKLLTPMEVYASGLFAPLLGRSIVGLAASVWAQVDWFLNPPPPAVFSVPVPSAVPYALLGLLFVAATAGHVRTWMLRRRGEVELSEEDLTISRIAWLSYAEFGLIYLAVTYMAIFVHLGWYQGGRYLCPADWALALFVVLGLARLWPAAEKRLVYVAPALLLALNGLCLFNLVAILNPAYVVR